MEVKQVRDRVRVQRQYVFPVRMQLRLVSDWTVFRHERVYERDRHEKPTQNEYSLTPEAPVPLLQSQRRGRASEHASLVLFVRARLCSFKFVFYVSVPPNKTKIGMFVV